ncbi:MAG: hypothetical protein QOJ58_776, partial [Alphaproteobacteria bacterium]|nr:hypothetical protein [Alphaproteobacteria bacterium]
PITPCVRPSHRGPDAGGGPSDLGCGRTNLAVRDVGDANCWRRIFRDATYRSPFVCPSPDIRRTVGTKRAKATRRASVRRSSVARRLMTTLSTSPISRPAADRLLVLTMRTNVRSPVMSSSRPVLMLSDWWRISPIFAGKYSKSRRASCRKQKGANRNICHWMNV